MIEDIIWIDPVYESMPDADTTVLVVDRFGEVFIASWDDEAEEWVEQCKTPHGFFSYRWPRDRCNCWAHMPAGPGVES